MGRGIPNKYNGLPFICKCLETYRNKVGIKMHGPTSVVFGMWSEVKDLDNLFTQA